MTGIFEINDEPGKEAEAELLSSSARLVISRQRTRSCQYTANSLVAQEMVRQIRKADDLLEADEAMVNAMLELLPSVWDNGYRVGRELK